MKDFVFLGLLVSECKGFPGGSVVKNCLPVQEMRVRSLAQEDPLEKEMANHSSILTWEIPWTQEPGRLYSPWVPKDLDTI